MHRSSFIYIYMSSTDPTTTVTEGATAGTGPVLVNRPARQNSLSTETLQTLEKRLAQRPDRQELQDRNILKDGNVAPALQAAREQLQRSQLEDKLDQKLLHRPKPEELVKSGILKPEEAPASA
ncbi:hypothetical protein F5148DRAFT_44860 [Russula earlei]|uniref:Uncharacterized protein n=1 Tax=Russula earlei TaxID=71964 RepID=A0ACC0U9P2_9AGAM|nr:hypothetical protein F5148DRAFT_44860 [Russula earlei]